MADTDFGALLADVSAPADTTTTDKTVDTTTHIDNTADVDNQADLDTTVHDTDTDAVDKTDLEADADAAGKGGDKITPTKIRAALKALRDSGDENAPIARELNDAYGRYQGYAKAFPKVADAVAAKTTLESLGGAEGIAKLQGTIAAVNETDQALYSGDKKVVESLYEDTVSNGHPEAFSKLAPHFLDTLAAKDAAAYEAVMGPRNLQFLDSVNFPGVVNALGKMLEAKDADGALKIVQEMARFYNDFSAKQKTAKVNPEQEAWKKEKEEFQTNQQKTFQNSVAQDADKESTSLIFNALKPYVKNNPYFKGWSARMMNNLGADIKREVVSTLKSDTAYQSQMKALWSVSKPNKEEILRYHKSIVDQKVPAVTKTVLDRDYTGYAKRGTTKTGTVTDKTKDKNNNNNRATNTTAVFVTAEPKREDIDWQRDPAGVLYTTNKAYLRKTGQLVSWGRKKA